MRIWLYYRLSRDEDEALNSLTNQRKIIYDYAVAQGYEIVGESFDDNVSGMHFNREGIEKIYDAVEEGRIDAVLVKDLSRLGRHRTQTALFIDYLREHDVRVLSATENIDTFNENDDLIIGFKGLMNDFYARDGSRRVRAGLRQKQKEGMVIIPPFGYFKDKNTQEILVVEEAAETVRLIYSLYAEGNGLKSIARILNEQGRKSPAKMQSILLRKRSPNTHDQITKKYRWDATMVKRILCDEIYTGTLVCHKSERNKINNTFRFTEPQEQFRHAHFLPAILSKELWEQAQFLMAQRKKSNARAGKGKKLLRYGGLLRCKDCGRALLGRRVKLKNGERIEYRCDTYHRYGKAHCSPHTIQEATLDKLIFNELQSCKKMYAQNWAAMQQLIDRWAPRQCVAAEQSARLRERIKNIEDELEVILMERIRDKANSARYDRMIEKREAEIASINKQIDELSNIDEILRKRQSELRRDIRLMDEILTEGKVSESHLRLLVEKIYVSEREGKLNLEILLKAPFRTHIDHYENGEVTSVDASMDFDFDRLGSILMADILAG